MPQKRVQTVTVANFTGGLTVRSDGMNLAPNEIPDCLNVDIEPRGGVTQRKGVEPLNPTALGGAVEAIWAYEAPGVQQVLVRTADDVVRYSTGGNFTSTGVSMTGQPPRAATFKNNNYWQDGSSAPRRWNGTTATSLTQTFNENLAAPNQGDMPIARYIAAHSGRLWVAHTLESAVSHPNRVRWSHPNQPEDWRTDDYIDIDTGVDGDEIVAIVPQGEVLLVFKRHAVYVVAGYDDSTYQVYPLSRDVGAAGPSAVVGTEAGCFFYDVNGGVHVVRGNRIDHLFERLMNVILDGSVPDAYASGVALGYSKRKLYVSVPWEGSTVNARTFVLDLDLSKQGSWTAYDVAAVRWCLWTPLGQDAQLLFADAAPARGLHVLNMSSPATFDNFGVSTAAIASHFETAWFDLRQPAMVKRWRRPAIVLSDETDATVHVEVYKDFDSYSSAGGFSLTTRTVAGNFLVWDSGNWDQAVWAGSGSHRDSVLDGAALGNAKAVRLRFTGPSTTAAWGLHSITFKFIPRKIR